MLEDFAPKARSNTDQPSAFEALDCHLYNNNSNGNNNDDEEGGGSGGGEKKEDLSHNCFEE